MIAAQQVLHSQSPIKRSTVLIVDDSEDIRFIYAVAINKLGFIAASAVNGQEALDLLRKGLRPDLIILDLMMPVLDGWQTDAVLSEDAELSKIPTVVLSAFSERASELTRKLEVIRKPLSLDLLQKIISKHCSKISEPTLVSHRG